jgi:hypothetical protein
MYLWITAAALFGLVIYFTAKLCEDIGMKLRVADLSIRIANGQRDEAYRRLNAELVTWHWPDPPSDRRIEQLLTSTKGERSIYRLWRGKTYITASDMNLIRSSTATRPRRWWSWH